MNTADAVIALSALAQETRLAIFRLLVQAKGELIAGDIAVQLRIAASTLSFHLKALQQAGLVLVRQEGRFMYYSAQREAFAQLLSFLTENCYGGAGCLVSDKGDATCQA